MRSGKGKTGNICKVRKNPHSSSGSPFKDQSSHYLGLTPDQRTTYERKDNVELWPDKNLADCLFDGPRKTVKRQFKSGQSMVQRRMSSGEMGLTMKWNIELEHYTSSVDQFKQGKLNQVQLEVAEERYQLAKTEYETCLAWYDSIA